MNTTKSVAITFFFIIMNACQHSEVSITERMPSDKRATSESVSLYNFLINVAGKGVMIGHEDAVSYGMGWKAGEFRSDVEKVCGDFPAVFGWDLGHITDSMNIDSVLFEDMKRWIKEAHKRGGINTISWHMRNPVNNSSSWDTMNVVKDLLPEGNLNALYNAWLDKVASFLDDLKDEKGIHIPVIFRPFHEQNGFWFWWGSATTSRGEYIQLFRYTVDYLRIEKQLHHILYAFSPNSFQTREEYLNTYPGDEYVDLLGVDSYCGYRDLPRDSVAMIHELKIVAQIADEKNKPAAFTETGYETLPYAEWWTKHLAEVLFYEGVKGKISYVLMWRNAHMKHFYMPFPGHESVPDFLKFHGMVETLFLKDIEKRNYE